MGFAGCRGPAPDGRGGQARSQTAATGSASRFPTDYRFLAPGAGAIATPKTSPKANRDTGIGAGTDIGTGGA